MKFGEKTLRKKTNEKDRFNNRNKRERQEKRT